MKRLLILVGVTAGSAVHAQTYKPDFDCQNIPPNNGVAVMLCQNSDTAKQELIFDQTYYALRQIVGPAGWKSLRQEVILAENDMNQRCGLPVPGVGDQSIPENGPSCYIDGISQLTTQYKNRLSGSALEEANRNIDQHIALQQKLIDLGYLPAGSTADGVYGQSTRQAISTWQRVANRPVSDGFLSDSDAINLSSFSQDNSTRNETKLVQTPNVDTSLMYKDDQNGSSENTIPKNHTSNQSTNSRDSYSSWILIAFFIGSIFAICIYFLPTFISIIRGGTKKTAVFIVNMFFGWTVLGWVAALVMAVSFEKQSDYDLRMMAMTRIAAGEK